ncbi:MAG: ATP-dependent sacrificial sulfur transferase LarE [Nitrospiraceae bacterium]|nr:ATP-dependent sacrificial sulfur transferase LarE [Nitrospiraceae bacterium]
MQALTAGQKKQKRLLEIMSGFESAIIAFSGGVDSTLVLKAASMAGIKKLLAVTSVSESHPEADAKNAVRLAGLMGVEHRLIKTNELADERYSSNGPRRCFYCKDELFGRLGEIAREGGYEHMLDGSSLDDAEDYRPGIEAARAHGVRSPLMEAGLGKGDIRELSRALGLDTWDRPSSPCLASRIPCGMPITAGELMRVAMAENVLKKFGFREFRVRDHGDVARIEVPEGELEKALSLRKEISAGVGKYFRFVCLDMEGFRSGSLNKIFLNGRDK